MQRVPEGQKDKFFASFPRAFDENCKEKGFGTLSDTSSTSFADEDDTSDTNE